MAGFLKRNVQSSTQVLGENFRAGALQAALKA